MLVVVRGTVIGRTASQTWESFAAFGDIEQWHPLIAHSVLEPAPGPGGGPVRSMTTQDGERIREELLLSDPVERTLRYTILDSPFPVTSYVAEVQVWESAAPDRCDVCWSTEFEPVDPADGPTLRTLFGQQVFEVGIASLQRTEN
ncbi:SRPBCC family protein [Streptomyces sp. CA-243310]|uniref:SRPBCC family protein n=1 Tax=Streptomyces sp. CA-243310 TaxID=3240056 RepID=UPI003D91878F